MSFGTAIGLYFRNYVNFYGRASRAEYWWPFLMRAIVYVGLFIAFLFTMGSDEYTASDDMNRAAMSVMFAGVIFWAVNFLPGLTVKVRRFHDLDQTGWLVPVFWTANLVVPLVEFGRLIWFAFPGVAGPNQYGPDPYTSNAEIFG